MTHEPRQAKSASIDSYLFQPAFERYFAYIFPIAPMPMIPSTGCSAAGASGVALGSTDKRDGFSGMVVDAVQGLRLHNLNCCDGCKDGVNVGVKSALRCDPQK